MEEGNPKIPAPFQRGAKAKDIPAFVLDENDWTKEEGSTKCFTLQSPSTVSVFWGSNSQQKTTTEKQLRFQRIKGYHVTLCTSHCAWNKPVLNKLFIFVGIMYVCVNDYFIILHLFFIIIMPPFEEEGAYCFFANVCPPVGKPNGFRSLSRTLFLTELSYFTCFLAWPYWICVLRSRSQDSLLQQVVSAHFLENYSPQSFNM